MSTRAHIAIRLKDTDKERTLVHTNDLNGKVLRKKDDTYQVTPDRYANYLFIYSHHDNYPSHTGKVLLSHYNDYENALNLVLAGDTSYIGEETTDAYAPYEGYEDVAPAQSNERPILDENYLYVFEDGKWFVQGGKIKELTELTEELTNA